MKNLTSYCFLTLLLIITSCTEKKEGTKTAPENKPMLVLPFQSLSLKDLTTFKTTSENWKIAGGAYVDRTKQKSLSYNNGSGVLVNVPEEEKRGNLFTVFEHGDIEFECDVMMPVTSNSGIYFQGRYEVQLLDSWGVKNPTYGDMGGIYQRWDKTKDKGEEGFEGTAPKINAAKAPGLWQHMKVIFHAPEFDASNTKIKNAWFEEVWLNGILIHQNVELSGPTRGGAAEEAAMAALMIQGDHGPVAFKNIKYKMYKGKKVTLSDITMAEYENKEVLFPNLDSLTPLRIVKTDSISALMVSGERPQRILKYHGNLHVPASGDYIFDYKVNVAGGLFLIGSDTIVNLNGDYNLDSLGYGKVGLKEGTMPFTLMYNKHLPWTIGFSLDVEGPGIQKHPLHAKNSLDLSRNRPSANIMVQALEEPITQRSFLMFNGEKRTHCISIGTPEKINYAYDLAAGSLLKVWSGDFLDATDMWHGRGEKQLGRPAGFTVSFHGDPEFVNLPGNSTVWPKNIPENANRRQLGYEFDAKGIPVFSYEIRNTVIEDKMLPSSTQRMLHRVINTKGNDEIWHKVADGRSIEKLADGTFIVNNESYFIDFSENKNLEPQVRSQNGHDELIVKIPSGEQQLNYSIIW